MRFIIDTSILVEVDRGNSEVIELLKQLTRDYDVFISVITVSEILTGSFLRKNHESAVKKAKRIMGQMIWVNIDPLIAEKAGEINAYLIISGKKIEFPDVLIAASSIILNCDYILTLNKDHFKRILSLENKVISPKELAEKLSINAKDNKDLARKIRDP